MSEECNMEFWLASKPKGWIKTYVASVVSASVVDRSIGIDNPHLSLGSQADLWCIEHLRYYFLGCLAEYPTFMGHSNLLIGLEEALKEKDDLKLKLEKFKESSKNLTKLINSQISAKDKADLGYDTQINENEVVHSLFNSKESDVDDSPVNDRFKTSEGFHTVPPPYTRNYMPSRPDLSFIGLDDSV
ncbi:hypothetical protein Tco_0699659 [Tanacetum coccineum]